MASARKFQVRLSAKAEQDVDDALTWLAARSVTAAAKWFAELMATIDTLERMPDRCARAAEADDLEREIRELLFGRRQGRFRILFEIRGYTVNVVHVRHGSRDALSTDDL